MKNFLLISLIASVSGCAQLTPNEMTGAIIGGVVGNQIGGGVGQTVATAAGAVIGANIGRQVPNYGTYSVPYPTQARGYPPLYYDGTYPIYERNAPCDNELYIDGVYNPPAARQYCYGRMERERRQQQRYENDAYRRGLGGQ